MSFFNWGKTFKGDNPPKSTTVAYVGVGTFRDACYQLVSAFLLTYITFAGVLSNNVQDYVSQMLVISIFIILCRIWDGVNDPIMGWIIEKVHFKGGKYRPWILIGGVLNTIVVLTLFCARPTGWGFVALFCVFYFLWDFAWTINDIAYWSMLPSLTSNEKRRNTITGWMQVFISIGVFAIYAVCSLLPSNAGNALGTADTYTIIAVVTCVLFLVSQLILAFTVKERDRAEEEALNKGDTSVKVKDIFTLFKRNDQFRINIVAIFLNYLGAGVLVAFATYYFYMIYGYGGGAESVGKGADISFMFTVMYAVGTLVSQVLYPLISKKLSRRKLLILSASIFTLGYVLMFLFGVPIFGAAPLAQPDNALLYVLYAAGVFIFFGQGIFSIVILMQMQSTIEYNEWKFGERKEALVSSMRAMSAKWASAIQQGLVFGTLAIAGLYGVTQQISSLEQQLNSGIIADKATLLTEANALINSNVTPQSIQILSIGMLVIPLILLLVSIFLSVKIFKIDEPMYATIMKDLESRKNVEVNE